VVGVNGFCLSLNCCDKFHQPASDGRVFASEGVDKIAEGLAPLHHPLFESGDLLVFGRELCVA
jgi:hypothetical protein